MGRARGAPRIEEEDVAAISVIVKTDKVYNLMEWNLYNLGKLSDSLGIKSETLPETLPEAQTSKFEDPF